MIRIKLLSVGKTKEHWLEDALQEYSKRLSCEATFEFIWLKDAGVLEQALLSESKVLVLDPAGPMPSSSEDFAAFFFKEVEKNGSRIVFAIGGPNGFSETIKKKFPLLSLSKLTFTHQMTRLILLEQIFRSFEIHKGSGYHK